MPNPWRLSHSSIVAIKVPHTKEVNSFDALMYEKSIERINYRMLLSEMKRKFGELHHSSSNSPSKLTMMLLLQLAVAFQILSIHIFTPEVTAWLLGLLCNTYYTCSSKSVLILKSTNNFCRISQDLSSKTLPLWKTSVTFAKCSKTCIRIGTCLYIHMPTCTLRRKQGCLLRPLFRPFILRIVADQTLRKSPVKRKRER